jgi:hypothetical protein
MSVTRIVIARQPDDTFTLIEGEQVPVLGASIGGTCELGYYLQFRGDPAQVAQMLELVNKVAQVALPAGTYKDESGRG